MKNVNDIKTFAIADFGNFGTGLAAAAEVTIHPSEGQTAGRGGFTTSILVIDKNGDPLTNAHLKWIGGGAITDQNGEATVSVPTDRTIITISYMGKRSHIAAFKDLINAMVTMQDQVNNLPPVIVGQPKPKTPAKPTNWIKTAGISIAALLLIAALSQSNKKGKSSGLNASKPKKKSKSKPKSKKKKGLRAPAPEITL